jgi:glycosyltransferase involved in cell wall biosynthesis
MKFNQKFLLLYPDLKPGGAAKLMVQMANALHINYHYVFVCTGGGALSSKIDANIRQYIFLNLSKDSNLIKKIIGYIKFIFFLRTIIKDNKITTIIIHHHYFAPALFIIKRISKVHVILNVGSTFKKVPFLKGKLLGDKIIAVSQAVQNHLIKNFKVTESNITVIYNGVESIQPKSLEFVINLKEKLGVGINDVVSCIGHFRDLKRQDFLLKAWKLLLKEHNNCHLVLLGFGETEQKLKDFVLENKIEDSVSILVNSHEPEDILNISKVFVLPSEREGLPLAILEAFSLGIPSIGTDTSGINEVIKHGVNGFLFEMDNIEQLKESIKTLLNNQEIYNKQCSAARSTFIEKFSFKKYSDNILNYFEN